MSSLDPARAEEVMDLPGEVVADRGRTLLVSLHDFTLARRRCDRIVGVRTAGWPSTFPPPRSPTTSVPPSTASTERMTETRGLTDLTSHEVGIFAGDGGDDTKAGHREGRRGGTWSVRRWWLVALVVAVAWALWSAGVGRRELVNPGGWTLLSGFWRAALHPQLSGEFLGVTWRATLTTVAFAVLGTALSVVIGVIGGVLTSETWWRRARPGWRQGRAGLRPGWFVGRGLFGLPRGIHEAVWGLFLVNVLGRDPMVGVLAIAVPFGAITAKV